MYDITGLTVAQIETLANMLTHHITVNNIKAPSHDSLSVLQQISVALVYLRRNRTQADLAFTYGVSQPTISRVNREWTTILAQALNDWIPTGDDLPEGDTYLVDGTLVACWSWKDHPENWSGKHKTTGLNLITVSRGDGSLACVSDPFPGCTHDLEALRQTNFLETPNTSWVGDKGFTGPEDIITPVKRQPGQKHLHPSDQEFNRQVSSLRAPIERANANLKTWRILFTDYRRPVGTFPETITAVLGLEFWRTS